MDTAVLDYGLAAEKGLNQARSDLVTSKTLPVLKYSPFFVKGELARWLPVLAMVSVFTGAVTDFDHSSRPLQRDQLSSARNITQLQQDRRISLREARQMALQVLAETEKNLHEERIAEARFIATLWDNDNQDA